MLTSQPLSATSPSPSSTSPSSSSFLLHPHLFSDNSSTMTMSEDQEKINHHHHHHQQQQQHRGSFNFHMPHFGHDKEDAGGGKPPKGMMAIRIGHQGEEQQQQRFVVPVERLNHPLFAELLQEAEKEYGFQQKGAIVIPCDVQHFLQVQEIIDRENSATDHHSHGHHRHLPCFGA